jgi:DNA-binding MarR family transcriptional regulator
MATPKQPSKSTVAGHQGPWVPFGKSMVCDDVWSGKKTPPNAWRVLWWLNNNMTGTAKLEDDPRIYGIVKGETPISFKDIAKDLQCSWGTVQRSVEWLVNKGMIKCGRHGYGEKYIFNVLNSIRQFELRIIEQPADNPDESKTTTFDIEQDEEIAFLEEQPTQERICSGCGNPWSLCDCVDVV